MRKYFLIMFLAIVCAFAIMTACSDAEVASENLSRAADQFEIYRRVVFYNGITGEYMLLIEGYCSIEVDDYDSQLELTVKVGPNQYLKHFLGLSDNVTYFVEQMDPATVSSDQYRVVFKPSEIIPMIEVETPAIQAPVTIH